MRTVGTHGPVIGPPTCGTTPVTIGQVCISVSLAADGIYYFYLIIDPIQYGDSLINLHQ
jgi:hypothetical protein